MDACGAPGWQGPGDRQRRQVGEVLEREWPKRGLQFCEVSQAHSDLPHPVLAPQFDLVETGEDGEPITPRLGVVHTRTLKMSDDVLCVRYSCTKDPTRLLLAVALLDCTVKVFYEDTLKFFLSLCVHQQLRGRARYVSASVLTQL